MLLEEQPKWMSSLEATEPISSPSSVENCQQRKTFLKIFTNGKNFPSATRKDLTSSSISNVVRFSAIQDNDEISTQEVSVPTDAILPAHRADTLPLTSQGQEMSFTSTSNKTTHPSTTIQRDITVFIHQEGSEESRIASTSSDRVNVNISSSGEEQRWANTLT
jgi:hypothetical protein